MRERGVAKATTRDRDFQSYCIARLRTAAGTTYELLLLSGTGIQERASNNKEERPSEPSEHSIEQNKKSEGLDFLEPCKPPPRAQAEADARD